MRKPAWRYGGQDIVLVQVLAVDSRGLVGLLVGALALGQRVPDLGILGGVELIAHGGHVDLAGALAVGAEGHCHLVALVIHRQRGVLVGTQADELHIVEHAHDLVGIDKNLFARGPPAMAPISISSVPSPMSKAESTSGVSAGKRAGAELLDRGETAAVRDHARAACHASMRSTDDAARLRRRSRPWRSSPWIVSTLLPAPDLEFGPRHRRPEAPARR
jgi:hypothetical protein